MLGSELSTTLSGEPIVDILIQAYNEVVSPNPFQDRYGRPITPLTPQATLMRDRIGNIPFAPYWGETFQDFRDCSDDNPTGSFAKEMFQAAGDIHVELLLGRVAHELAGKFSERVLEADLDLPGLQAVPIHVPRLSPLALLLLEKRETLDEDVAMLGELESSESISSSWIRYSHSLVFQDEARHDRLFHEVIIECSAGDDKLKRNEKSGKTQGKPQSLNRKDGLRSAIAQTLGCHLPELVVSHLVEPNLLTASPQIITDLQLLPRHT